MMKPTFAFLVEAMCNNDRIKSIRAKINNEGLFTIAGPGNGEDCHYSGNKMVC